MPEVIVHENLYSLVARFIQLNGCTYQLQATRIFFDSQDISIVDTTLYESQHGLYKKYYPKNAHSHLLTLENVRLQLGEILRDGQIIVKKSTLQTESFGDVSYWRYCPNCFDCDMKHHGVAIWYLAHQLPTTLVCMVHQVNLNEISLKKKYLHEQVWLLHQAMQFKKVYEEPLGMHWHKIAIIAQSILDEKEPPLAAWAIRQTLIDTFRTRRFVDGKAILKIHVFEEAFTKFFGIAFVNTLKERLNIKKPRYLATEVLKGFKGRELHRIILIYWLFGSWQYFTSSCSWQTIFNIGDMDNHSLTLHKTKQVDGVKIKSRELCESYLLITDKPNRIEFCRLFYSDFRWLLNYDKAWFDRMLPAHGFSRQLKLKF